MSQQLAVRDATDTALWAPHTPTTTAALSATVTQDWAELDDATCDLFVDLLFGSKPHF